MAGEKKTGWQASRVRSVDFLLEVAKGNVAGHSVVNINGRNPAVGLTFEDIWDGGQLEELDYDAQTANFTPGLVLTGGTSNATATIVTDIDNGTTGTLCLRNIVGTFQDGETITDSGTGSATSDGVPVSQGLLVYPTTGEQWEVICESADDDITGTGARTLFITFIDFTTRTTNTELIELNGQTAVQLVTGNAFRFDRGAILTWGSATNALMGKSNTGTIVVRETTTKALRAVVPFDDTVAADAFGSNNTRDIHFTVPNGKTAYLTNLAVNVSKNHEVDTIIFARLPGSEGFQSLAEQSIYQNSVTIDTTKAVVSLPARTDIKGSARSNNTVVAVNLILSFLLVDDE